MQAHPASRRVFSCQACASRCSPAKTRNRQTRAIASTLQLASCGVGVFHACPAGRRASSARH
eukprot:10429278-Alexandrium_andersonii.AAC.1